MFQTIVGGARLRVPDAQRVAFLRHGRVAVAVPQHVARQVQHAPVRQHLHLVVHGPERRALVGQAVQLAAGGVDLDQAGGGGAALEAGQVDDVAVRAAGHDVGLLALRRLEVPDDVALAVERRQAEELALPELQERDGQGGRAPPHVEYGVAQALGQRAGGEGGGSRGRRQTAAGAERAHLVPILGRGPQAEQMHGERGAPAFRGRRAQHFAVCGPIVDHHAAGRGQLAFHHGDQRVAGVDARGSVQRRRGSRRFVIRPSASRRDQQGGRKRSPSGNPQCLGYNCGAS